MDLTDTSGLTAATTLCCHTEDIQDTKDILQLNTTDRRKVIHKDTQEKLKTHLHLVCCF